MVNTDITMVFPGKEKHRPFYSSLVGGNLINYAYRNAKGNLFLYIGETLQECRNKRNEWMKSNIGE